MAPGPVPVLWGRGGVLGAGRDRPAAAGHRRGGPGGSLPRPSWPRAGRVRPRPGRARVRRCAAGPAARSGLRRGWRGGRCPGRSCSPGGGCFSSGSPRAPGGAADRGRRGGRRRAAGFPGAPGRLGTGTAGVCAGARPPGAGPGPARAGQRPQPVHADPRPARPGLHGGTGGGAGAGHAGGGTVPADRPGAGHPPVRGGNGPLADRPRHRPAVDGAYRLVGQVGTLDVPEGLHALLAARLDALDPPVRRLVADASVLGTTFPAEALAAVSRPGPAAVHAGLSELVRREVLDVRPTPCRRSGATTGSPTSCCAGSPTTPCRAAIARPAT